MADSQKQRALPKEESTAFAGSLRVTDSAIHSSFPLTDMDAFLLRALIFLRIF